MVQSSPTTVASCSVAWITVLSWTEVRAPMMIDP